MSRIPAIDAIDQYIGDLYRARQSVSSEQFKPWALERLKQHIPFEAALWGTGNVESRQFHSTTMTGLPDSYVQALEATQDSNPMLPALLSGVGKAQTMSSVFPDRKFYQSALYKDCFGIFGVERILSVIESDTRSGIYTLLSLYRFDRRSDFKKTEIRTQERCAYHLVNAASHAFFSHLAASGDDSDRGQTAICDAQGIFYEVQPRFLDLLDKHFPKRCSNRLPFDTPEINTSSQQGPISVACIRFGDLRKIRLWEPSPLDELTEKERRIALLVSQGMTFKEIGRKLNLAPSTVSNHMYRVYRKLGIASRAALADLVHGESDSN